MRITILAVLVLVQTAVAQMGPAMVEVQAVRQGTPELSRPVVGTVEASVRSTLAAEEAGVVAERRFDEGQAVAAGDVLVRTNVDLLKSQINAAEAAVAGLVAEARQAEAERQRATLEVERMRPAVEQKAAPQMELDDAERDLSVADAVLANRRAQQLEKQAELDRLRLMLQKSEVRTPITGVVARRYVEIGQWIRQGDPVADVVQLDPLLVRADVPESLIRRIKKGDLVAITIEALGDQPVQGTVDQILPEADPASRTFGVKVAIPNDGGRIRPGFFARVTFQDSSGESSLIVPRDAVIYRDTSSFVATVREGKAVLVPVRVISASGETAYIAGDLKAGESAITRGNDSLRGGEPVMVAGAPPPPSSQPAK